MLAAWLAAWLAMAPLASSAWTADSAWSPAVEQRVGDRWPLLQVLGAVYGLDATELAAVCVVESGMQDSAENVDTHGACQVLASLHLRRPDGRVPPTLCEAGIACSRSQLHTWIGVWAGAWVMWWTRRFHRDEYLCRYNGKAAPCEFERRVRAVQQIVRRVFG